jgi:hypothetical protein
MSSPIKWAKSVPITDAYREIRQLNSPLHLVGYVLVADQD